MQEPNRNTQPPFPEPATVPDQPEATAPLKRTMPIIIGLGAIILVIGLANVGSVLSGSRREAPKSALPQRPAAPNAQQVKSFQTQQAIEAQQDSENRMRQQQLAAQMQQLQAEQAIPGPEGANAAPMTPAQRQAIYGNSPNAPQQTSGVSEAQAQAKQRALAREKEHQDAVNSDTVAIDFARSGTSNSGTNVLAAKAAAPETARSEDITPQTVSNEGGSSGPTPEGQQAGPDGVVSPEHPAKLQNVSAQQKNNPMAAYDFDAYQGRLYRVFEGTVFEGIVTNHIDGGFNGPILIMLTTDYYSHDHQQLLLPQGTRLIGTVQAVNSGQQRKLFAVFNRAVCPDGFSIDLNKFIGLDPLGTTGLATKVDHGYFTTFAAAAIVGGLGGLAQIGNSGSVLDSSTQIRNGISSQTAQEGEQILSHFLNRLPVITLKEGSRARVYIGRDILIPSYADHRVDPAL